MTIQQILKELHDLGVIENRLTTLKPLSGGTSSTIFAVLDDLHPVYVIKLNNPATIEAESVYLRTYSEIDLLPRFMYVDPSYRYLVYTYKPGDMQYPRGNKAKLLLSLVKDFIMKHKPFEGKIGYGHIDEPVESWRDFLQGRASWSKQVISNRLPEQDHELVQSLIQKMDESHIQFLLHGDCGVHNFLFHDGILSGVIDPTPVIGEPLYDLIYAFCSSPDDLSLNIIQDAASLLDAKIIGNRILHEEVIKGLYFRISTCIEHHPDDLEQYLIAWSYWKGLKNH